MFHQRRLLGRISLYLTAAGVALLCCVSVSRSQTEGKTSGDAKLADSQKGIIRIKAGVDKPFKDSKGNIWLPDVPTKDGGFDGGETIERPDLEIANTKEPGIYRAERYSMDSFSWKLPNGKYVVKLHFAETYDGIGGPGDRVFAFKVQNKDFKDFDVWKKSGGMQKAYIETIPVEITDGKLKITFTPIQQNPQINAVEIIPADMAEAADKPVDSSPAKDKSAAGKSSSSDAPAPSEDLDASKPARLTSNQDHQRLMDLLNIISIRRGPVRATARVH
jgi:hypothetical protein